MSSVNQSSGEQHHRERRSIFWPLFLIAIGVMFLLDNAGFLTGDVWGLVWRFWPLLFIVGGLDGLWKGEGIAGSLFWLGVGVIFLLANLNYLNISVMDVIFRFWPVLLVAIGLDLIIGRRGGALAQILAVVIALSLLGGLVWFAATQPPIRSQTMESEQVREALQGAKDARAEISMGAGKLELRAGATGDTLVTGAVGTIADRSISKSYSVQNGHAVLELKQSQVPFFMFNDGNIASHNSWDLRFNPAIPTDFKLNLGFGQGEVNLQELQPAGLDATVAFGQLVVTLPEEGSFDVNADVVFGEVVVRVPKGLSVRIKSGHVFGGLSTEGDFTQNGNIITNGSGEPEVEVDAGTVFGGVRIVEIP